MVTHHPLCHFGGNRFISEEDFKQVTDMLRVNFHQNIVASENLSKSQTVDHLAMDTVYDFFN